MRAGAECAPAVGKTAERKPKTVKITAQARYALRILLDIAVHDDGLPRPIKDIAAAQGISEKFIGRIAIPLRRAGLLATVRGAKGGLQLGRFPEKITLLDIVEAVDGPLSLVHCLVRPGVCARQGHCAAEIAWSGVNEALAGALRRVRLSDVLETDRRYAGMETGNAPEYCI